MKYNLGSLLILQIFKECMQVIFKKSMQVNNLDDFIDPTNFQRMVGSLHCLTNIKLDIKYGLGLISRSRDSQC